MSKATLFQIIQIVRNLNQVLNSKLQTPISSFLVAFRLEIGVWKLEFLKLAFYRNLSGIVLLSVGLTACLGDKSKDIPDVSAIPVNYNIHRFEQALFALDTNDIQAEVAILEQKYPDFTEFYLQSILQVKKPWDTTGIYKQHIKGFLTYPFTQQLYDTTQIVFHDFSKIDQRLKQGFQFYQHYFPDKDVPDIYTFISEFSYGIVLPPIDNTIGIGLDLFLGKDYPYYYYPPLSLPAYIARTQDQAHLPAKVFEGVVDDLVGEANGGKFLDLIIHNGKKLYVLDHLLPYEPDSIKLGFTDAQTNWCAENELEMWAFFLKEELLYSNEYKKFKSLVSDSPFATGMPPEAPGKAGNWVGWQIVKAYMQRQPDRTLQELVAITDTQEIFSKSRYKPKN